LKEERVKRRNFLKISIILASAIQKGFSQIEQIYQFENSFLHKGKLKEITGCIGCEKDCKFEGWVEGNFVKTQIQKLSFFPATTVIDSNPKGCPIGIISLIANYDKRRVFFCYVGEKSVSCEEAIKSFVKQAKKIKKENFLIAVGKSLLNRERLKNISDFSKKIGVNFLPPFRYKICKTLKEKLGNFLVECNFRELFFAETIIFWGVNPAVSAIEKFHYITESRYKGTKIITIGIDFNNTARISSKWIKIDSSKDYFLILGIIKVIYENRWFEEDFLRHKTSAPFLVNTQNGKIIKQEEFLEGEGEFELIKEGVVHKKDKQICLDFEGSILLKNREEVKAKTIFLIIEEYVKNFDFKEITKECGVKYEEIVFLSKELKFKNSQIVIGKSLAKYLNSKETLELFGTMLSLIAKGFSKGGVCCEGCFFDTNIEPTIISKEIKGMLMFGKSSLNNTFLQKLDFLAIADYKKNIQAKTDIFFGIKLNYEIEEKFLKNSVISKQIINGFENIIDERLLIKKIEKEWNLKEELAKEAKKKFSYGMFYPFFPPKRFTKKQSSFYRLILTASKYSKGKDYRESKTLLELQRGSKPIFKISPFIAQTKKLKDGDIIKIVSGIYKAEGIVKVCQGIDNKTIIGEKGWFKFPCAIEDDVLDEWILKEEIYPLRYLWISRK